MQKLDIAKNVIGLVVGTGAGKIAKDIIKSNTTPKSQLDTITYAAGAVALGGVAAEAAKKYTASKIDEYAESYEKVRAQLKKNGIETPADAVDAAKDAANDAVEQAKNALDGDDSPQA